MNRIDTHVHRDRENDRRQDKNDRCGFHEVAGDQQQHIQQQLLSGKDVILEIDWQGARQIRQLMSGCKSIYVLPPSIQALRERLQGREQDSDDVIEARMREAVSEMKHYAEFDYIVINDNFDFALGQLKAIMSAESCRTERILPSVQDLFNVK